MYLFSNEADRPRGPAVVDDVVYDTAKKAHRPAGWPCDAPVEELTKMLRLLLHPASPMGCA